MQRPLATNFYFDGLPQCRLTKYDSVYMQATDLRKHLTSSNTDTFLLGGSDHSSGVTNTQAPAMRPKLFDKEGNWKPNRMSSQLANSPNSGGATVEFSRTGASQSTNNNPFYWADTETPDWSMEFSPGEQPHTREAVNQELVDLLRSQVASLLEEKEKILSNLDEYRERLTVMNRERKESAPDPSSDLLALQSELSDARLREAELTVAFGELQHRIAEIDRMIESDPEMEAFFNAVTISPTTLSRQKPLQRTPSVRNDSPSTRKTRNVRSACESEGHFSSGRNQPIYSNDYRSPKHIAVNQSPTRNRRTTSRSGASYAISTSGDHYSQGEMDSDQSATYPRSGLESPQSDSGCSLNSHSTSEGREHNIDPSFDEAYPRKVSIYGRVGRSATAASNADQDGEDQDAQDNTEKTHSGRPTGFVSLIRRSRSTAAEHSFMSGFHSETHSPVGYDDTNDAASYTPTPTDTHPTMPNNEAVSVDSKPNDRFSRLRASFRQSFGFGPTKPDFRTEAFAARQGEARALLSLRETRMELLRVQSRCQTLQRHMERLEAINHSRMEELEGAVGSERELRQEIRVLQRRIFELEAEHREFKVNQRIKEMELMSKLAEANMRLSHAELNNQQAAVWSELKQAHDAASNLLTSAQSNLSIYSPGGMTTPGSRDQSANRPSPTGTERSRTEKITGIGTTTRTRPSFEHSMTRMDALKRSSDTDDLKASNRNTSCNDLSTTTGKSDVRYSLEKKTNQRDLDQSLGSLSELCLQPDISPITPSPKS